LSDATKKVPPDGKELHELATLPLYGRFQGRETKIKSVRYLEARLLDAFGYGRDSEDTFRELIESDLEEGFYKDAFIHGRATSPGTLPRYRSRIR
jgi:hypothetical protein